MPRNEVMDSEERVYTSPVIIYVMGQAVLRGILAVVAQCVGRSKAPAHTIYQEDLVNIYISQEVAKGIYIFPRK